MFEQHVQTSNAFLADILALREDARKIMATSPASPDASIALLQTVLAAEIACVTRYTMISISPEGLANDWIGAEFQEQAKDERRHMSMAAARIEQLGGTPDFARPLRCAAATLATGAFAARVRENLAAERSVIEHYHELIRFLAPIDQESCAVLNEIMRDEQDHTSDMEDLLASYTN